MAGQILYKNNSHEGPLISSVPEEYHPRCQIQYQTEALPRLLCSFAVATLILFEPIAQSPQTGIQ